MGDANCFNRRFHLLLVVTRSLSDYLMLKRSPGPKVRGVPSSTIGLPEGSFLINFVTEYSYPSRKMELKGGLCYEKKKEHLTGLCKNSVAWTQATWLQSPKQSLANLSSGLDAVVFIHWLRVVQQLLAGR